MPASFGNRIVLSAFVERHPRLSVQIMLEDKVQDMVREAIDLGIRIGDLPDAAGTSKLLGSVRVVVAAPAYLAMVALPTVPQNLSRLRMIGGPAATQATAWHFQRGTEKAQVDLRPHISVNDTSGAVGAATAGLGVTSTTLWACQQELDNGALIRLVPEWLLPSLSVHAYFPTGRATRKAARAFVEFVAEILHTKPGARDDA